MWLSPPQKVLPRQSPQHPSISACRDIDLGAAAVAAAEKQNEDEAEVPPLQLGAVV